MISCDLIRPLAGGGRPEKAVGPGDDQHHISKTTAPCSFKPARPGSHFEVVLNAVGRY